MLRKHIEREVMSESKHFTHNRIGKWCNYSNLNARYNDKYSLFSIKMLSPKPMDIILDNGCGNGRFSQILSGNARTIIATDISPFMTRATKERKLNNVNVTITDSQNLPFRSSTFDKIICIHNMWYIPLYEKAVYEMQRLSKTGGCVVLDQISEKWNTKDHPIHFRIIYKIRNIIDTILNIFERRQRRYKETPTFYRSSSQFIRPFKKYNCKFYSVLSPPLLYQILDIFPIIRTLIKNKLWSSTLVEGFEKLAHRWLVIQEMERTDNPNETS